MLVLSRQAGERVRIGDDIELIIIKLRGNRVQIGFEAPIDVRIVRGELPRIDPAGGEVESTKEGPVK